MKVSFVSTSALSQTLRYQIARLQREQADRQQEMITGALADPGAVLGARAGSTFSMKRDIERLQGIVVSNGIAANRLTATQKGLEELGNLSQDLLSTLTSGVGDPATVLTLAQRALGSMTSVLNSSFNGEYLFAGINTDVKPLNDFTDPNSPNKAQFDELFLDFFGFSQTDPAASDITPEQINDFFDTALTPSLMGDGWDSWSNASDQTITSRIALNETAETSTTANDPGVRRLAIAAAALNEFLQLPLSTETQAAIYHKTQSLVSQAIGDFTATQTKLGIAENRVEDASTRLSSQIDLFKVFVKDLEGVDPYEALTRVNELVTQTETAYALTARLQQLNLLRYLS